MTIRAETRYGTVEGVSDGAVSSFLGVPYGGPTGGANRFLPPRSPESWTGVQTATTWGPRSYQSMAPNPLHLAFPRTFDAIVGDDLQNVVPMSEDCLTLNVWTPAVQSSEFRVQSEGVEPQNSRATQTRPVLVWFHGGGSNGSPSESRADGSALAKRGDVVVVSVTHRLNVFGYLYLGSIAGVGYAASGCAGLLDLMLALEWVRDNVAEFGGDPGNVTVFGESAGGAKVAWLLSMPEARGLFHKAVIQSGAETTTGLGATLAAAESFTDDVLTEVGLTRSRWQGLLDLPAERLVAAHEAVSARRQIPYVLPPPGPTIDGAVLSRAPIEAVEQGLTADVPLIIGACADELQLFTMKRDYLAESSTFNVQRSTGSGGSRTAEAATSRDRQGAAENSSPDHPSNEQKLTLGASGPRPLVPSGEAELRRWLGDGAGEIIEAYRRGRPTSEADEIDAAIRGDRQFLIPSLRFAEAHLRVAKSPVYVYSFAWKSELAPRLGAFHSLDISFFFDRTQAIPLASGDPSAGPLAAQMSDALIAFARFGTPSHQGIPEWAEYDLDRRSTMIFDRRCRMESDPRSEEMSAWNIVPTSRLGFWPG
jgi:para-nitrobenzyl esterase